MISQTLSKAPRAVAVCQMDDLLTGVGVAALVDAHQIAIFKLRSGDIHAVGNYDPFSDANVISRGLVGDLKGRKVVASPIYKQHFDLVNGQCLEDGEVFLPVYAVSVHDGVVSVHLP